MWCCWDTGSRADSDLDAERQRLRASILRKTDEADLQSVRQENSGEKATNEDNETHKSRLSLERAENNDHRQSIRISVVLVKL